MKPAQPQPPRDPRAASNSRADWRQLLIERVAVGTLAAVMICRLLTPTDGAITGETLWIAQFSLLAFLVWAFAAWRAETLSLYFDWLDVSVLLLVLGHVVGALVLISTSGDKRAAMTMLWEWVGLGVTFFLMRRLLVTSANRQNIVLAVASMAAVLAGLGIWQHQFGFAQSRRGYEELKARLEALERGGRPADPEAALDWERSLAGVRSDFVQMNIPSDDSARMLWEQRLYSAEPIALFALANTLAGILAVGLLLWLGGFVENVRRLSRPALAGASLVVLLIAYCLLLTKSRTAWAGLLAGLTGWVFSARLTRSKSPASMKRMIAAGIVVVGLLAALAYSSGGLDRFVLSESLKSLRYRIEYWTATGRMVLKTPRNLLLGVGPGNFRQNYLEFKLPQSSEEVADPHNLVLDVWANGGLIGLAGLAGVCFCGVRPLWRPNRLRESRLQTESVVKAKTKPADAAPPTWSDGVVPGGVFGFLVTLLLGLGDEATLAFSLISWLLIILVCRPVFPSGSLNTVAAAACLALIVHLSGAGGIGMPAVSQTLLLMAMLASPAGSVADGISHRPETDRSVGQAGSTAWSLHSESRAPATIVGAAGVAIYLACWFAGLMPIVTVQRLMSSAKEELFDRGRPSQAERDFRLAAEFDQWSPAACERLAEMSLQNWLATDQDTGEEFEHSVKWQTEAIVRDPRNPGGYRILGEIYLAKMARSGHAADAQAAADAFERAATLYPNRSLIISELAESLWKAGRLPDAKAAARRARELDQLNQDAGHTDKVLTEARRRVLAEILAEDSN